MPGTPPSPTKPSGRTKSGPPALTDAQRLDLLAECGGFVRGSADGQPAFRIFGSDAWHPDLRLAADAVAHLLSTKKAED